MNSKLLFIFIIILITVVPSCSKNPDVNKIKKVQAAVDKVREDLSGTLGIPFPSLNVLIQTPSEKIFVSSVAANVQPVTAHTYFRFASNTKNFTSASLLNMYEDGWINYKAKIIDVIPGSKLAYVPDSPDWDFPHKNEITIEQLLQHSAGVFDVDNDPVPGYNNLTYTEYIQQANPTHQFTTDEMVKVLKDKNLSYFSPGTGYHYSNTGFSILAKIIARVYSFKAGKDKTYADYLNDFITGTAAPVPLKTIHFPVLASDISMPDPHLIATVLTPDGTEKYDQFNMSAQVGEGNGYGTMDDLNTYIRSMMTGQNVLKPATVQLMQHDVSGANPTYGLGCSHVEGLGYGHNGARIGYLSLMMYDPQYDISVIAMISLFDFRDGANSFLKCYNSLADAAYAARKVLGYPGKP